MRNTVKERAKGEGKRRRRQNAQPGIDREYHSVAIILKPTTKLHMTEQLSGRVISISLHTVGLPTHIINFYTPQSRGNTQQKELFYDTLERHFNKFSRAHIKCILGDFNIRLHTKNEHEFMFGPHVWPWAPIPAQCLRRSDGKHTFNLKFCANNDLCVINIWFRKQGNP